MPTTAEVIEKYIAYRDFIKRETDAFTARMKPYQDAMTAFEAFGALELQKLLPAGAPVTEKVSLKTPSGTMYRSTVMRVKVDDRAEFMDFVFDGQREGFITSAVSKEAVAEYLDSHNSVPPPGVGVGYVHNVNFRKASE